MQDARLAVLERLIRRSRADRVPGWVVRGIVAGVAQDDFTVGDGDGDGRRGGQQQLADSLGSFGGQPLLGGVERLAGDFQQLGVKRSARPICVKKLAIRGFLGAGSKSLSVMLPVNLALLRLAASIQSCPTISPFDRCATAQDSDPWRVRRR